MCVFCGKFGSLPRKVCVSRNISVNLHQIKKPKQTNAMTKRFYRDEYFKPQWKALIDKAHEIGCIVTYSRYGDVATIDSTEVETSLLKNTGKRINDSTARYEWACHILDVTLPKAAAAAK